MGTAQPRALIAAPARIINELGTALEGVVESVGAETFDDAVQKLQALTVDILIPCYAFDEVRPFRLLHHVRQELVTGHVPTILVRALPVPIGQNEEDQIRDAYKTLGVDVFFNLHDLAMRTTRESALRKFREAVLSLLPQRREKSSGTGGNPTA